MRIIVMVIFTILLTACTSESQEVAINPSINTPVNDIGHERIVGFSIKDKRNNVKFAKTEDQTHLALNSTHSLIDALSENSEKMISAYGFTPGMYNKVNGRNIEMTVLSNEVSTKKIQGHLIHSAGVSIFVKANNHGKLYQKVYSARVAHNISNHNKYTNDEMVANLTKAYNQVLDKIDSDKKLWRTLT